MSELVLPRTVRGLLDVQTIARPDAVYALALDTGDGAQQAQRSISFAAGRYRVASHAQWFEYFALIDGRHARWLVRQSGESTFKP